MEKQLAALNFALGMEKEGKAFFEKAAASARNLGAKQAFTNLANMEEGHIAYIQANIESLTKGGKWTVNPTDEMDQAKMDQFVQDLRAVNAPDKEVAE